MGKSPRMNGRGVVYFAVLMALVLGLASACQKSNPIVGRWRANGPSNLLFEYRKDGTVALIEEARTYPMFHYQLKENSLIHLYDGLGRRQELRYSIDGNEMTHYLTTGSGTEVKETFRREELP